MTGNVIPKQDGEHMLAGGAAELLIGIFAVLKAGAVYVPMAAKGVLAEMESLKGKVEIKPWKLVTSS